MDCICRPRHHAALCRYIVGTKQVTHGARDDLLYYYLKKLRLHAVSVNSGQITRNVQIIDGEVDVVIILKAIKDCTTDRINVVRKVAAQAMEEFQNANVIPSV